MAELADAPDLGSGGEIRAGSTPVTRMINNVDTGFCVSIVFVWRNFVNYPPPKRRRFVSIR